MDKLLNRKITAKRVVLEHMININSNLQDEDVLACSRELDKLIVEYERITSQKCFLMA